MTKYSFRDDYSEGGHPAILKALGETNMGQQLAYGEDAYSLEAKSLIHRHLNCPGASIFFVAGGTLANLIGIASLLRPHEAVISAQSGHIAAHETGAIEATGHKIISVMSADGKLRPADITACVESNSMAPHMAKPRLVYISNAAETGRIYDRPELSALSETCRDLGLLLFLDGARLGAALTSPASDLTLADVAAFTDMFWIGGTKAGALIGEAIVIPNPELAQDFRFHIKQRGALLAKGRLLGLQFRALFRGRLFFENCEHANDLAQKLSLAISAKGYGFADETQTNQVFPVLPNAIITRLSQDFDFHIWEPRSGDMSVIRLVTSWATPDRAVDGLLEKI